MDVPDNFLLSFPCTGWQGKDASEAGGRDGFLLKMGGCDPRRGAWEGAHRPGGCVRGGGAKYFYRGTNSHHATFGQGACVLGESLACKS